MDAGQPPSRAARRSSTHESGALSPGGFGSRRRQHREQRSAGRRHSGSRMHVPRGSDVSIRVPGLAQPDDASQAGGTAPPGHAGSGIGRPRGRSESSIGPGPGVSAVSPEASWADDACPCRGLAHRSAGTCETRRLARPTRWSAGGRDGPAGCRPGWPAWAGRAYPNGPACPRGRACSIGRSPACRHRPSGPSCPNGRCGHLVPTVPTVPTVPSGEPMRSAVTDATDGRPERRHRDHGGRPRSSPGAVPRCDDSTSGHPAGRCGEHRRDGERPAAPCAPDARAPADHRRRAR
jgi:hypothetical protein